MTRPTPTSAPRSSQPGRADLKTISGIPITTRVSAWPKPHQAPIRAAARIGAWWGFGHALTLVVIGIPLIVFKSALPGWLERGAEVGVGLVILALAGRVVWKWLQGDY